MADTDEKIKFIQHAIRVYSDRINQHLLKIGELEAKIDKVKCELNSLSGFNPRRDYFVRLFNEDIEKYKHKVDSRMLEIDNLYMQMTDLINLMQQSM